MKKHVKTPHVPTFRRPLARIKMSGYVQLPIFQQIEQVHTYVQSKFLIWHFFIKQKWKKWHKVMNNYCLFHWPNYKFQKLADVWVAHNIDYRKITLSEQPLSAGNFGEVFKGKDVHIYGLTSTWYMSANTRILFL